MKRRWGFGEQPTFEEPAKEHRRQTLVEEATDICSVKDCYDGFVSREIKGYSTLFGCPVCKRWDRTVVGKTSIPTIKRWMGGYDQYTEEEMVVIMRMRMEDVVTLKGKLSYKGEDES